MATPPTVVVVGAGLSGLLAARRLAAAGATVTVVDKGRGVGGRLATRRIGEARLDHGAQFLTVRSDAFASLVDGWLGSGVARIWCRGFAGRPDGHPRYVGADGMTTLAKSLAADLDVRVATRVGAVRATDAGWRVELGDRPGSLAADAVILTPPVPQTVALLDAGAVVLDEGARPALDAVAYDPTLAGLVVPARDAPGVPEPGGVQLDPADGPLSWLGDNMAKGISPVPAVTVHVGGRTSAAWWDDPVEESLDRVLAAAAPWTGPGAEVGGAQLMRWRYATPVRLHDDRCLVAVDGPRPLVCAGDAFGEARVEGAARSGWAAADAVIERVL